MDMGTCEGQCNADYRDSVQFESEFLIIEVWMVFVSNEMISVGVL